MNGPFQVAQANIAAQSSGKPAARVVKITKPFGDQSVVVPLSYDGSVKADLSAIAGEKITLVHIGEKLIILFDNKSTVTLEPFFDSTGKPLNSITVEVSPGRDLTGTEFATLFPVTEDQSVLPAAGNGGSNAQASGAYFTSVGVDPLALPGPLDLLGQEELPNFVITNILTPNIDTDLLPSQIAGARVGGVTEEEQLGGIIFERPSLNVEQLVNQLNWITSGGKEDPNDVSLPNSNGGTSDGLDQDTTEDSNITTQHFHGAGADALTNLVSGGNPPLKFTIDTGIPNSQVVDSTGKVVTSAGHELHYSAIDTSVAGDNTIVGGYSEGEGGFHEVFRLTIHSDGTYDFELIDKIDHPVHTTDNGSTSNGHLEETLFLDFTTLVHVADLDNDNFTLTGAGAFTIGVIDDTPEVHVSAAESESGLVLNVLDESIGADHGVGNNGNGAADDTANILPDPLGLKPFGEVKSGDFSLASLFSVNGTTGEDGFGSVDYAFTLKLSGEGLATSLSVTDPNHLYGSDSTIYLFTEGDQIVGRVGAADGAIALRISIENPSDPATAHFVVDQYLPVNHGDDGNNFDSSLPLTLVGEGTLGITLTATVTDGDQDVATSTATVTIIDNETTPINIEDDGPTVTPREGETSPLAVLNLDETIGADRYNTGESESEGSASNGADDKAATVTVSVDPLQNQAIGELSTGAGALAALFTAAGIDFGTDGPAAGGGVATQLSLVLSSETVGTNLTATALVGTPLQNLTAGQRAIELVQINETTLVGRIVGDGNPATDDQYVAFRITLENADNPATAKITVDQFLAIDHGGSENPSVFDEQTLLKLIEDSTLNLKLVTTVTDGDGDHVSLPVEVNLISGDDSFIAFDDDGPTVSASKATGFSLVHDETLLPQNPNDILFTSVFNTVSNPGHDPETLGLPIGYARSAGSALSAPVVDYGTDGAAKTGAKVYSLTLTTGNGATDGPVDSGIKTTEKHEIFLFKEGNFIVGRYDAADGDVSSADPAAFALYIDPATGVVSLVQYVSLYHNNPNDPDDSISLANIAGHLNATVTVTDGDGDKASASADIAANIRFEDDGPAVAVVVRHGFSVTADETFGTQSDDVDGPLTIFAGVTDVGQDPDNAMQPLAYATNNTPALTVVPYFGVDGPATSNAIAYSLTLNGGNGTSSGLKLTDGTTISLFVDPANNNIIVGRVDSGLLAGKAAFAVAIDPATGNVSVVEYLSIQHNLNGLNPNDQVSIANNKIFATVTITDGDNDTASASADISGKIHFNDDGPTIVVRADATEQELAALALKFDETIGPPSGDHYNQGEPQSLGGSSNANADDTANKTVTLTTNALSTAQFGELMTQTGLLNGLFTTPAINYGADGPGQPPASSTLSLVLTGAAGAGYKTNLVATALAGGPLEGTSVDHRTVWLTVEGGQIVGRIGHDTAGNTGDDYVAFRISLSSTDPATAQLIVDQFLPIDHDASEPTGFQTAENPSLFDETISLLMANASQSVGLKLTVTATDGDNDSVTQTATATLITDGASFVSFDDDGPNIAASNACVGTPLTYTGIKAGHVDERGLNGPGDHDVLLSGIGTNHNEINTTGSDIGVGNQWIDSTETLRLDFVNGVSFSGNGGNATYDYNGHYLVKAASFNIAQIKGAPGNTATVFVQAFDANDNKDYTDDGAPLPINLNDVTVTGDATFTKTLVYDNGIVIGVVISGLDLNATVTVDTAADFDRLVLKNYAGVTFQDTAGGHTTSFAGDDFSVGGVSSVICTGATLSVTHDESAGFGAQGPNPQDDVDPATAPSELTAAIASAGIPVVLGFAESSGTASNLFGAVTYGTDGPAATNPIAYKFTTSAGAAFNGQDSGLNTTVGNKDIFLFSDSSNPNIVWGVDSNNFQTGQKVFALYLDGQGHIWVAQFSAIAHDISGSSAADFDDEVSITNGLLFITATATDGDGDKAYAVSPAGIYVNFQDDGPIAVADVDSVQSGATATGNVIVGGTDGGDANTTDGNPDTVGADGGAVSGVVTGTHLGTPVTDGTGVATAITTSLGTLTLQANGSYTYVAKPNTSGTDVFTYTLTDGDGDTSTTTLTITINSGRPTANPDTQTVDEAALDTFTDGSDLAPAAVTGSLGLASSNETKTGTVVYSDPDSPHVTKIAFGANTASVTNVPGQINGTYGILQIDQDGHYTYTLTNNSLLHNTAGANIDGVTEVFTYTVTDAFLNTQTNTITISIKDDIPSVTVNQALTENGAPVSPPTLIFDESIGTDPLDSNATSDDVAGVTTLTASVNPTAAQAIGHLPGSGSLSVAGLFSVAEVHGADGATRQDTYSFTLKDDNGNVVSSSTTGVQTILSVTDVTGTPLASLAAGDLVVWLYRTSATTIEGRIGHDSVNTADNYVAFRATLTGSNLTVDQFLPIEHGNTGSFDEQAFLKLVDPDASLGVTLTVKLTDGDNDVATSSATVILANSQTSSIVIEDDGPDAVNDGPVTTNENQAVLINVKANDSAGTDGVNWSNAQTSNVTYTNPGHGTIVYNNDGTFTYTPNAGFDGSDSFTYTIKDGDGDTDTATVSVTVNPVVDTPTIVSDLVGNNLLIKEDATNTVHLTATAGATDVITSVVINGLTTGATYIINGTTVAGSAGTYTVTFAGNHQNEVVTIVVAPGADSDVDLTTLSAVATAKDADHILVGDPSVNSAAVTVPIVVDAILDDAVSLASVAQVVNEPVAAASFSLGLDGTAINPFAGSGAGGVDGDGSESGTLTLTLNAPLPTGVTLGFAVGYAGPTTIGMSDPTHYTLTGFASTTDLAAAIDALVAKVPAGFDGAITGSVTVTFKEANTPSGTVAGSGAEPDTADNTYTSTTSFSLTVNETPPVPSETLSVTAVTIKEDSSGTFAVTAHTNNTTDELTAITFTKLPPASTGWTVQINPGSGFVTVLPDASGNYVYTPASGTQDQTLTVKLIPAADSDKDVSNVMSGDITVTATATDIGGGLSTTTPAQTVNVDVDAVLDDAVSVSSLANNIVNEPVAAASFSLGLIGSAINPFAGSGAGGVDGDGSESGTATIILDAPLPTGVTLGFAVGYAGPTTIGMSDPTHYTLTGFASTTDLAAAIDALVAKVPAGFDGAITGSVTVTFTEANTPAGTVADSGAEPDTGDNTYTSTENFSLTVKETPPVPSETLSVTAVTIKEDSSGTFAVTAHTNNTTDELTAITFTKLPPASTGWTVQIDSGSGFVTVLPDASGNYVYTPASGTQNQTLTVKLIPAADSDKDVSNVMSGDITVTATATDIGGGLSTTTPAQTVNVDVDAILDDAVSLASVAQVVNEPVAAASFSLGLDGTAINPFAGSGAGGVDGDGSESGTVVITLNAPLPAGVTLGFAVGYAGSTAIGMPDPTHYTLTGFASTADLAAAIDALVAKVPAGFDGAITGSVTVTFTEANTPSGTVAGSGAEPDTADNTYTSTTSFSLTVNETPPVPSETLSVTAVTIKEDSSGTFAVTAHTNNTTDELTAITFTKLPPASTGWTVQIDSGSGFVTVLPDASGNYVYTPASGTQNQTLTVKLIPAADSDKDVSTVMSGDITVTATATDIGGGLSTTTPAQTVNVDVDAILDQFVDATGATSSTTGTGSAQTISLGLTASVATTPFTGAGNGGPDTDGSETTKATITLSAALPAGASLSLASGAAISLVSVDSTHFTLTGTAAQVQDALTKVQVTVPGTFTGTVTGSVSTTSTEANTPAGTIAGSGAEPDVTDNTYTDPTPAAFSVTVKSPVPEVVDGLSALTVNEAALDTSKDGSDLAAGVKTGTNSASTGETHVDTNGLQFKAVGENIVSIKFADPNNTSDAYADPTFANLGSGTPHWTLSADGRTLTLDFSGQTALILGLTGASTVTAGATGNVTVTATLVDRFAHQLPPTALDVILNGVKVVATDTSGDQVAGTVSVNIVDDVPLAVGETATAQEKIIQDFNAAFVLDFSSSIDNSELNQMLTAVKAAGDEIFNNATGNVSIRLIAFGSTSLAYGPLTTKAAFDAQIDALNPAVPGGARPINSSTDFTDAIQTLMANYVKVAGANNQVFFLSDGNPNEQTSGSSVLLPATATAWSNFVNTGTTVNVTTIGIGDGISTSSLQQIDVDGTGTPLTVAQFGDLIDTLVAVVNTNVTGNVLTNDKFGADGGRLLSIKVGATEYTWDGASTITKDTGGSPINGTSFSVTTAIGGTFTFYFAAGGGHAAGDWVYSAPVELVSNTPEVFNYVLIDNDGDKTTPVALTINVTAVNDAPVNTVPGAQSVAEEAVLAFTGAKQISIADVDGGSGSETVTLGVLHGTLNLASTSGLTVTGLNTGTVVISGTIANINTALAGLTYVSVTDYNGSDTLTVTTNDNGNTGAGGAKSDVDTIAITVTPVNDNPIATPDTFSVTEANIQTATSGSMLNVGNVITKAPADSDPENNTLTVTSITAPTITETDAQLSITSITSISLGSGEVARYEIVTNTGTARFSMSTNGLVELWTTSGDPFQGLGVGESATLNFNYTISDGNGGTASAPVVVTITGTNDNVSITSSASVSIPENTTAVTTVTTNDLDGDTIAYSLVNTAGTDFSKFTINSSTGALSFITPPNFEAPNDVGGTDNDNVYTVVVQATDNNGSTVQQTISVTVTNVNEFAPVITSAAAVSVAENFLTTTAAYTATATDADAGTTITYSLTGTDAALFNINASNGQVKFNTSPNFEAPADNGGNNVYDIIVHANDGTNDTTKAVAITVTNVDETPTAPNATLYTSISGGSGTAITIPQAALLLLGTEPDGQALSFVTANNAGNGSISPNTPAGSVTFTDNNTNGGTFDYTIQDPTAHQDSGTVTVNRAQLGESTLDGGAGNDILLGRNSADDTLIGGGGMDILIGGTGADHFRFNALSEVGDHILDFSGTPGQGDSIDLLLSAFSSLTGPGGGAAVAAADFSVQASAANAANADIGTAHLSYYQGTSASDPGKLYYDSDGGTSANRILVAIFDNHAQVTANDIHKV